MGWRPIEAAPRDQTVLLYCSKRPKHRYHIGVFRGMCVSCGVPAARCHAPAHTGNRIGGVTHWMPLPEPPEQ